MDLPKKKNPRKRKFLLTINNPADHGLTQDTILNTIQDLGSVKYLVMSDETGTNNTYHTHVFMVFENALRFSTIKNAFPAAHIDIPLGSCRECRDYIFKDSPKYIKEEDGKYKYKDASGTEHSGQNFTATHIEIGTCPEEKPGKRNDLEAIYFLIQEGYSNGQIIDALGETALRNIYLIERFRQTFLTEKFRSERRVNIRVHYIYGATGTGKTRDILDEHGDANVYRVTDYQHPFDGYSTQNTIVFEEFRSSLRLHDMLSYLDIYSVELPARYNNKLAMYTNVYICSNWSFEQQYSELRKDPEQKTSYEAWCRRINGSIKEYHADGSISIYSSLTEYLKRMEDFISVTDTDEIPFDKEEAEQLPID